MGAFEDFVNLELPRRSALLTKAITSYDADPNLGGAPAIIQGAPLGTWFYEETANKWWRRKGAAPTTWSDQTSGGAAGFDRREETFTPTLGQTVFTLAATPATPNDTSVFVNTVKYIYGTSFSVAGNQVTWIPGAAGFALDALDVVEIIYFV
jgi:hypothetical protein